MCVRKINTNFLPIQSREPYLPTHIFDILVKISKTFQILLRFQNHANNALNLENINMQMNIMASFNMTLQR